MENPATWKRAELIIGDARAEWVDMDDCGAVGPSIDKYIANKLREAGLLNDQDEPEIGWDGLRAHLKSA